MSFSVDYSSDYQYAEGVAAASYTAPGGSPDACFAKPTELTARDLQGAIAGVEAGDRPFVVWALATEPKANGTFTFDGLTYTVIGSRARGDGAQWFVIGRLQRS